MSNFKVLFLYPNGKLMNPPPISIGIFTALLKQTGIDVDLFDTTLYANLEKKGSDEAKQENLQVRPFDYVSRGVQLKETRMEDDLIKKVEAFHPDLIAISMLECTYSISSTMLKAIENFDIPVLAGGIFSTFASGIVSANKNIKMICIGEGEDFLAEMCHRMAQHKDYSGTKNLWYRKNGRIVMNKLFKPVDINSLPIPDYCLFESQRFFRPMAGKVYKTIPIETNRGCPYQCSYCNSPSTFELYKTSHFNFFRKKSISKIYSELKHLVKRWDAEYVYFSSDNFLVFSDEEFEDFIEAYKDIGLPFWIQSRPEIITEDKIRKLKDVGLHRISLGLEHGNEEFRKKVLKKFFKNDVMIRASKILADADVPLTVNNIIGFPDETRELIFDTIELNRKLIFDTSNCATFAPFHGTPLQKVCVEKGYISDDFIFGSINVDVPLDMPQLSREEIKGLRRTFALYARMPKEFWPLIKKAEKFDEEGNKIFADLSSIYQEMFFGTMKAKSDR